MRSMPNARGGDDAQLLSAAEISTPRATKPQRRARRRTRCDRAPRLRLPVTALQPEEDSMNDIGYVILIASVGVLTSPLVELVWMVAKKFAKKRTPDLGSDV